jgi:ubiquinone/menaquinone biosynthesis C-methylase UbiE
MSEEKFLKHKEEWEKLIAHDPMWAVLSDHQKKGNNWDADEFYETGKKSINRVMKHLLPFLSESRGVALDFGCGLGRLSFPLTEYFTKVIGVDVTRAAIERAKKRMGSENVEFYTNERSDLKFIGDSEVDLVVSLITLQHIRPLYSKKYIAEFLRVLNPQGLAYFQLPSHLIISDLYTFLYALIPNGIFKQISNFVHSNADEGFMEMNSLRRSVVEKIVRANGGEVLEVREDKSAGEKWKSYTYIVRKK